METIKFKDVAHLYLNSCEVKTVFSDIVEGAGIIPKGTLIPFTVTVYEHMLKIPGSRYENCKPILRKLDSMTEEEAIYLEYFMYGIPDFCLGDRDILLKSFINDTSEYRPSFSIYVKATNWLRKNNFDIDELINSGEAIDASTIPKQ